ncbi:MAG: NUDIX domain-containing protein, partial [Candidatus Omnitrophica bacterium]|nr:NUDIX domain-containing protein [Candidatus Omnitrophota bacterium]
CQAKRLGLQEKIPPPATPIRRKKIRYLCGIVERNGLVLIARRPVSGLLGGLWEFPGTDQPHSERHERQVLAREIRRGLGIRISPKSFRAELHQTLTHRELEIRAFACRFQGGELRPRKYPEARWVPKAELSGFPLTTGMRRIAEKGGLLALPLSPRSHLGAALKAGVAVEIPIGED